MIVVCNYHLKRRQNCSTIRQNIIPYCQENANWHGFDISRKSYKTQINEIRDSIFNRRILQHDKSIQTNMLNNFTNKFYSPLKSNLMDP